MPSTNPMKLYVENWVYIQFAVQLVFNILWQTKRKSDKWHYLQKTHIVLKPDLDFRLVQILNKLT